MVPPEYLPAGCTVIPQPRNMNKDYLARFISHVLVQQASMPANEVFRFSHWRTRNGGIRPAQYPQRDENGQPIRGTKPPGKQRNAKKKVPTQVRQGTGTIPETGTQTPGASRRGPASGPEQATGRDRRDGAQEGAEQPMELITQSEMDALALHGHPIIVPINGPAAGPPQYLVTRATAQALRQQPTPQSTPQRDNSDRPEPQIDPALLEDVVPTGRKLRSAKKDTHQPAANTRSPLPQKRPMTEPSRRSNRRH